MTPAPFLHSRCATTSASPVSVCCEILRGEAARLRLDDDDAAEVVRTAAEHGVLALVFDEWLRAGRRGDELPQAREAVRHLTMWELAHHALLRRVVEAFRDAGIDALFLKGSALAYALYPQPALRTRGDTDLLVRPAQAAAAHRVLERLGLVRRSGVSGEFASYQASYRYDAGAGGDHLIDLHWRINNSQLLSALFTFDELWADAIQVPALAAGARTTNRVAAMTLACVHRAVHDTQPYHVGDHVQAGSDRLVWLYDIHLLARTFSASEWHAFAGLANTKGLRSVCRDALHAAQAHLETVIPPGTLDALAAPAPQASDRASRYLRASRTRQALADLQALGTLRNRLRFLSEVALPSAGYMRAKYPHAAIRALPWLHLRRALEGALKRLPAPRLARRAAALDGAELRTLGQAGVLLWKIWFQLRWWQALRSPGSVQASSACERVDAQQARALARWVSIAAKYSGAPSSCLTRSMALHELLARRQLASELRIGVRLGPRGMEAHAWVECGGAPVNDEAMAAGSFAPFPGAIPWAAFRRS